MDRPRRTARAGFTLLEAILALLLLGAAVVACLDLRLQMMGGARQLEAALARERHLQSIFDLVVAGSLGPPEVNEADGARRWRGDQLGVPFEVEARKRTLDHPVHDPLKRIDPPTVEVWVYSIRSEVGDAAEFVWFQ